MHERLPKNSCDTHLHVFGEAKTYPIGNPNALYQPPQDCTFEVMKALHDSMGIDRAVFVQPTIYGTDHSLLHDVLKAAPKGKYRGVAIVDDSVSDAELDRLNRVGVRGARFNFGGNFKLAPSIESFRRSLDRVRELGWFVKVFGFGDDFLAVEAELRKIKMPAIIDHLGGPVAERGTSGTGHANDARPAEERKLVGGPFQWRPALAARRAVGRHGGVRPDVLRGGARPLYVGNRLAARPSFHQDPARTRTRATHRTRVQIVICSNAMS